MVRVWYIQPLRRADLGVLCLSERCVPGCLPGSKSQPSELGDVFKRLLFLPLRWCLLHSKCNSKRLYVPNLPLDSSNRHPAIFSVSPLFLFLSLRGGGTPLRPLGGYGAPGWSGRVTPLRPPKRAAVWGSPRERTNPPRAAQGAAMELGKQQLPVLLNTTHFHIC